MLSHRVRDDFLAVATLALGLLTRQLIVNFGFTGGVNGFQWIDCASLPNLVFARAYDELFSCLWVCSARRVVEHETYVLRGRVVSGWLRVKMNSLRSPAE